jgi:hypothetical protein
MVHTIEPREIYDSEPPTTLAGLHLLAERKHDREAVLQTRSDGHWVRMPDWRFDRHVIRVGLFLHERLGLEAGDRIALMGPLRAEWVVADWAAVTRGATSVVVEGTLADAAWEAIGPRAVFVPGPDAVEGLLALPGLGKSLRKIVVFEGPTPSEQALSYTEVLDLGGTLDTAERANAFRALARGVSPDSRAFSHTRPRADGSLDMVSLTHREVVERLRRHWSVSPPRKRRVEFVDVSMRTPAEHVALYGLVADGLTCTALGPEVTS